MSDDLNDHDLLIELRADVKALRGELAEMKDGLKTTVQDHETRIRALEASASQGCGSERVVTGTLAVIASAIIAFIIKHIHI